MKRLNKINTVVSKIIQLSKLLKFQIFPSKSSEIFILRSYLLLKNEANVLFINLPNMDRWALWYFIHVSFRGLGYWGSSSCCCCFVVVYFIMFSDQPVFLSKYFLEIMINAIKMFWVTLHDSHSDTWIGSKQVLWSKLYQIY